MMSAIRDVMAASQTYKADLRTSALLLAVQRVAEAIEVRGIYP